jgi:Sigma-70, region 4
VPIHQSLSALAWIRNPPSNCFKSEIWLGLAGILPWWTLINHFGIGTEEEESFESIGTRLGLTSERVRQLHKQGLAKLRRKLKGDGRNLGALANYLGNS